MAKLLLIDNTAINVSNCLSIHMNSDSYYLEIEFDKYTIRLTYRNQKLLTDEFDKLLSSKSKYNLIKSNAFRFEKFDI